MAAAYSPVTLLPSAAKLFPLLAIFDFVIAHDLPYLFPFRVVCVKHRHFPLPWDGHLRISDSSISEVFGYYGAKTNPFSSGFVAIFYWRKQATVDFLMSQTGLKERNENAALWADHGP